MEINAPYFKGSSITGGGQNDANLHLYLHEVAGNPGNNGCGMMAINDWTVRKGLDLGSNVFARAPGMHAQCGKNNPRWYVNFNMVFDDAWYVYML